MSTCHFNASIVDRPFPQYRTRVLSQSGEIGPSLPLAVLTRYS